MMPLMKVTDMSYERSVPGRILGYGRFVMESAGQDQALREVNWVPEPDEHYRAICAEIFGVADHSLDDPDDGHDDRWDDGWDDGWDDKQPPSGGIPDPYAGWDDPRHTPRPPASSPGPRSRSGPGPQSGPRSGPRSTPRSGTDPRSGSLYRSPDLQARDRAADTGPIPIRPRRDWADD
jgi:hypothetical protein